MDILNNILELDTLYENKELHYLLHKDICISIPFNKIINDVVCDIIPLDYSAYLHIVFLYHHLTYLVLDIKLVINNDNKIYLFEFDYYWNYHTNEYLFKNNHYQLDPFCSYIKDTIDETNGILLTGSILNTLIFNSNYPKLGKL